MTRSEVITKPQPPRRHTVPLGHRAQATAWPSTAKTREQQSHVECAVMHTVPVCAAAAELTDIRPVFSECSGENRVEKAL